jgi:hypothetical protein
MLLEWAVRERTQPLVIVPAVIGVLFAVAAVFAGGVERVLLAALAVVAVLVTLIAVLLRRAVLAALRLLVGGSEFDVVQPIVHRHFRDLRDAQTSLPLSRPGFFRMLLLTRHPTRINATVRETGDAVVRAVPEVVGEVRTALRRD